MASRAKSPRADEDALDPVEAADVEAPDDADEGLLELQEPPEDIDEDIDEDIEDDDDGDDGDALSLDEDDAAAEPVVELDADDDAVSAVALHDAAFDDDEDEVVAVAVDLDDDDEVEGVRDGEFVCRSCYMAKRDTQLADAERLLCRDCA